MLPCPFVARDEIHKKPERSGTKGGTAAMRRRDKDGERERRRSYRRQRDNAFVGKAVTKLKDSHGATETKSLSRNPRFSSHDPSIVSAPTPTSRWRSTFRRRPCIFRLVCSCSAFARAIVARDTRYSEDKKWNFTWKRGTLICVAVSAPSERGFGLRLSTELDAKVF